MAAWLATEASTSRSSWLNCLRSLVSSWMIPSAWPSGVTSGAHMTERILRSAMEALVGRFTSLPASWLSTAFFWPITWFSSDRLMESWPSSAGTRVNRPRIPACFFSRTLWKVWPIPRFGSSTLSSARKVRSACGKISTRASRILGATLSSLRLLERLREISRIALSLASGFTAQASRSDREASTECRVASDWGASVTISCGSAGAGSSGGYFR